MALGFVLVSTAPGKDHDAYNQLLKVPEIKEIMPLFGEFDLIVKIEANTFDELGRVVNDSIRTVPHVLGTKTLTGTKF